MKKLLLLLLTTIVTIVTASAQQDSTIFRKEIGPTGDSVWYKYTIKKEVYAQANDDSLIRLVIQNRIEQASKSYAAAQAAWKEQQKTYEQELKRTEKQFTDLYGEKPKLDTLSNAKQIIGKWLIEGVEYEIKPNLRLDTKQIKFWSEVQFEVVFKDKRRTFFKKNENAWVSDDELRMTRVTSKSIKSK